MGHADPWHPLNAARPNPSHQIPAEPMAILVAQTVSIGITPSLSWINAREEEVEPTTEVAPGEPPGADHVDRVVGGEVGEERVVEDIGAHEPEVGEQEQPEGQQHVTGGGEEEKRRQDRPPDGEHHQKSPLRAGEIGDGAEHGRRQEHDQRAGADGEGPEVLTGPIATEEGEPVRRLRPRRRNRRGERRPGSSWHMPSSPSRR